MDGTELYVESDGIDGPRQLMTYHVFYTAEFLQQEFPDAKILPPVNGEMQACCLLGHSIVRPDSRYATALRKRCRRNRPGGGATRVR